MSTDATMGFKTKSQIKLLHSLSQYIMISCHEHIHVANQRVKRGCLSIFSPVIATVFCEL